MVGVETAVGLVVASYLSVLSLALVYLAYESMGADAREQVEARQMEHGSG